VGKGDSNVSYKLRPAMRKVSAFRIEQSLKEKCIKHFPELAATARSAAAKFSEYERGTTA